MSRGFGATFGGGISDALETSYAGTQATNISYSAWFYINAAGGGSSGKIIDQGNGGTAISMSLSTFSMRFLTNGSTVASWTAPSLSQWHHVCVVYTASNTVLPIVYQDGVAISVSGSVSNALSTGNMWIGNRSSGSRQWDGMIAHVAYWNGTLLTAGEALALASGVSPLLIRPDGLSLYFPLDGVNKPEFDFINALAVSVTGTALGTSDPPIQPLIRLRSLFDYATLAQKTVFYTTTGSITLPSDFNPSNNTIECIGESGNASGGGTVNSGSGGGGGAYAKILNYNGTQGGSVSVTVGTGGTSTKTIFDTTNNSCIADFGTSASGTTAGLGGLSTNSTGTTKFSGGNGGAGAAAQAGGSGGGAAGPSGAGGNAASSTNLTSGNGGTADNGKQAGGAGVSVLAVGNPGIAETPAVWVQTSNGATASPSSGASGAFGISSLTAPEAGGSAVNYGGAPGGGNMASSSSAGGASSPGIIVLTYIPTGPISLGAKFRKTLSMLGARIGVRQAQAS